MLRNLIVIVTLGLVALLPFVTKENDANVSAGIRILRDLPYTEASKDPEQQLDLYLPQIKYSSKLPLVVWIHGGGWKAGDKNDTPAFEMANRGYAVASLNYRLSQHAVFPAQIYDCKAAIRWLRAHGEDYNMNVSRIGVWGASAGGHLAALLGVSNGVSQLEGDLGNPKQSSSVQAVCDFCGPVDLPAFNQQVMAPMYRQFKAEDLVNELLGGTPEQKKELAVEASPINFISKDDPPFMVVHSTEDPIVPFEQSDKFVQKLKEAGVSVTFIKVEGNNHMPLNNKTFAAVYDFFDEKIKAPDAAAQQEPE